jgi:hypothetical protein
MQRRQILEYPTVGTENIFACSSMVSFIRQMN